METTTIASLGHPSHSSTARSTDGDLLSSSSHALFPAWADWKRRLKLIDAMMREMSEQEDPQAMVRSYGTTLRQLMPTDRFVAVSRRGLELPRFRVTRSSMW